MSGVICDSERVKGTVYKVAVRPAMLYGFETVALTKRQEAEMEVAELKMLRFSLGVTRMDKIRNEYIRGTAQVGKFGQKTREARLGWYGHLRRKDDGYIGRRMLMMELPGKRKRGRPKRRFMDVVKEDMAEVEVTEEDTVDRNNWRRKTAVATPDGKSRKKKKTLNKFQFAVYFKSAVTFFHGNGEELLGVKRPPTNSKTIISLCTKVVLVLGKHTYPLSCKKYNL